MAPRSEQSDAGPEAESAWRRQVNNILETQIARRPFLVQMRAVWRQLQDERAIWPVLLPLVAVVFYLVYRRERRLVVAALREVRK
ncbi:MAG TPA: hypothetical protein PKD53_02350 [Chloroflexaceae bacterium]|nr:hypothetical protein [Chloroflexaceae bacterium]